VFGAAPKAGAKKVEPKTPAPDAARADPKPEGGGKKEGGN